MTQQKTVSLASILLVCWPAVFAAEQEVELPDTELLEFLGSMAEEFDEWELFVELATVEIPPDFVQTEFVETEDE